MSSRKHKEEREEEEERGEGKMDEYWLHLETPAERRSRLVSLYIVHAAMLVFSLGFSIVLTGISFAMFFKWICRSQYTAEQFTTKQLHK
jgi:hypothetical protein